VEEVDEWRTRFFQLIRVAFRGQLVVQWHNAANEVRVADENTRQKDIECYPIATKKQIEL
jgi:hypothetical protein